MVMVWLSYTTGTAAQPLNQMQSSIVSEDRQTDRQTETDRKTDRHHQQQQHKLKTSYNHIFNNIDHVLCNNYSPSAHWI